MRLATTIRGGVARVLVAEDDEIYRMVLTRLLTDFGCRLECAKTGGWPSSRGAGGV
jgi:CheY-like chemotaxis protein